MILLVSIVLRIFSNPAANVFQKQLTARGHHPLLVNFLTYFLLSAVCIVIAVRTPFSDLTAEWWMYSLLAGIAGACGNGFLVKALEKGELSVLGPINAYKSVVGMLVGIVLLREIPNAWGIVGMLLIIAGSYFILDTMGERFSWALFGRKEIQYRLWALILTAIEAILIKRVIQLSSPEVGFLSWCWTGAFFSFWLAKLYGQKIGPEISKIRPYDIKRFAWLVICIGIMQFSTNYVFKYMDVGYALALFQLSVIVSVFFGHRYFGEKNILKKLVGAVIMLAGSVLIILLKDR